jgi:hypothetical protein
MNITPPDIDVCIVCGRRPELLSQTLESFARFIFPYLSIVNVYANIDPFCGDESDAELVKNLLTNYFPKCQFFTPTEASFGGAVKRLWSATKSEFILHLEDDWVAKEPIDWLDLNSELSGNIRCLSFMTAEKNWRKHSLLHTRYVKYKILGITYWRNRVSCFTTSPCFLRGDFARSCGLLLNPNLDPEKQFSNGLNMELESFSRNYSNKFLFGRTSDFIIQDIGRTYRDNKGLAKKIIDGVSIWSNSDLKK